MAVTTILGRQSVLAAGLSISGDAAPVRSYSSIEAVGVPCLRISSRSSLLKESSTCQLRSEFLSSFTATIPLRQRRSNRAGAQRGGALTTTSSASAVGELKQARDDIKTLLAEKKCHPILIRLGWHDSGSFDKNISGWPKRGGANGSLRFALELGHAANSGLGNALLLLQKIKDKFPGITYADLFQLASATAIEDAGGPKVPMRYGRVDTVSEAECAIEGNLPEGAPPDPADHLRKVFYRMGLNDKEIVALSGAHTVGRSRANRSGFGKPETKYTNPKDKFIGEPGGQSWTVDWLTFDNSYFKDILAQSDEDLLVLPTDKILTEDPDFKAYTEKYAKDQDAFFMDYAEAHAKLSELGSKFDPPEGYSIDGVESATEAVKEGAAEAVKEVAAPVAEKFVASKYSSTAEGSTQTPLSENMKNKIRAEYLAVGGSPDKPLKSNYFLNIMIVIAVLAVLSSFVTQNQGGGF